MSKVLFIAGHGLNRRNGYFDSGATGFISKGEHKYYKEDIFPKMKQYLHKDDVNKAIFHDSYNVYSENNIVSLAKTYGSDTQVIECHYDATGSSTAKGGHVIVYSGFKADKLDLALRDFIGSHLGLAYPTHKGDKGISGRSDLRNVIACANNGVNYRLIELGFCTNKSQADYMVNNTDKIARDFVMAVFGRVGRSELPNKKLYRVQSGAFEYLENAKQLEQELKQDGYDTYIVKY